MRTTVLAAALMVAMGVLTSAGAAEGKIAVVAAENFYGDVAGQIGGERVAVRSILSSPDRDPHLFETSPAVIRDVAAADVVVYNGAGYDLWMERLIAAAPKAGRAVIVAADLMPGKPADNPHLWYDPATMPAVAAALSAAFSAADPAHRDDYAARLRAFIASLAPMQEKIATLRGKYAGAPVAATEPVFGYMAAALKLAMRHARFQLAVMNGTEPAARDIAAFERDLSARKVRVLFYDRQAVDGLIRNLLDRARAANIPVVGVTETCPAGLSYQDWMLRELDETGAALAGSAS